MLLCRMVLQLHFSCSDLSKPGMYNICEFGKINHF